MAFPLALTTLAAAFLSAVPDRDPLPPAPPLRPGAPERPLQPPRTDAARRRDRGDRGAILGAAGAGLRDSTPKALALVLAAAAGLALVGAIDDVRPLPPGPRLLAQALAVAAVVLGAGPDAALAPFLPPPVETAGLLLAGLWFVNLVNFMDGIDWMSVAELVPVTAALAIFGAAGLLPIPVALLAAVLLGGTLGFAPFNRPVARLFLGDVGSLPLGLLVGWMLLHLAATGAGAAALLLPLYYLADATLTLLRRLLRGERVWEAHREHFYQQAGANGFAVPEIVGRVFGLNLALAALAALTLLRPSLQTDAAALAAGAVLVGLTLNRFATRRDETQAPRGTAS
jgi:UDP-N-acetylmuramyl pentapeptide phosphotransferase/UDP-N-acetylglucosamine-1-phosphate transferase